MRRLVLILICLTPSLILMADSRVMARKAGAATGAPVATRVALQVIATGGTAADAAVAAAFALALEDSSACGLGGGGVVLYYDRETGVTSALDFTPGATNDLFMDSPAESAGLVPGFTAGLAVLHERYGTLRWDAVLDWVSSLARDHVHERLAATLARVADSPTALYEGRLAIELAEDAQLAGLGLTPRDLESYSASWVAPIRIDYGPFEVFSILPPNGAGIAFAETLTLMSGFDLSVDVDSPEFAHVLLESARQALIDDAELFEARSAGGRMPYDELLAAERLNRVREGIDPTRASRETRVFEPPESGGASFTIVDREKNVAVGTVNGCGCAEPVLLEKTGISMCPADEVSPRSAAALPLIIFEEGRPWVAFSSDGGFGDLPSTIRMLFGLSRGVELERLMRWPRLGWDPRTDQVLYHREDAETNLIERLSRMGHALSISSGIGEFNIIHWKDDGLLVISDREKGSAGGI